MHRVKGVYNIHSAGVRTVRYTECRSQEYVMKRVQGLVVCNEKSSRAQLKITFFQYEPPQAHSIALQQCLQLPSQYRYPLTVLTSPSANSLFSPPPQYRPPFQATPLVQIHPPSLSTDPPFSPSPLYRPPCPLSVNTPIQATP